MRPTRLDDSSSGDGLPSHRQIDTFGRRVVIPDTATGISEPTISQGRSVVVGRGHSTISPGADTQVRAATHSTISASYCVHREAHRKADCPDTFGIVLASMLWPRARTKGLCAGVEVGLPTEAIRKE